MVDPGHPPTLSLLLPAAESPHWRSGPQTPRPVINPKFLAGAQFASRCPRAQEGWAHGPFSDVGPGSCLTEMNAQRVNGAASACDSGPRWVVRGRKRADGSLYLRARIPSQGGDTRLLSFQVCLSNSASAILSCLFTSSSAVAPYAAVPLNSSNSLIPIHVLARIQ